MQKLSLLVVLFAFLATGCSSLRSQTDLPRNKEATYHSYTIKNATDETVIDPKISAIFENELNTRLKAYGYEYGDDVIISYNIKAYDEGNRALRMVIGFGAGKSNLEVLTTLTDKDGKAIGSIDSKSALKMGFFGGSLESIIRKTAKDTARRIYRARILTRTTK